MNESKGYFSKYILKPLAAWAALVAVDQASKYIVKASLIPGETKAVAPFFNLTHLTNTGMAFSMFQGANVVFMTFTFVVLTGIAVWFAKNAPKLEPLAATAVVLIAAGAAGNLIDRILSGHVTDFLDFYAGSYHWPSFNAADSCISVGGCLLFIWIVMPSKGKEINVPDNN